MRHLELTLHLRDLKHLKLNFMILYTEHGQPIEIDRVGLKLFRTDELSSAQQYAVEWRSEVCPLYAKRRTMNRVINGYVHTYFQPSNLIRYGVFLIKPDIEPSTNTPITKILRNE